MMKNFKTVIAFSLVLFSMGSVRAVTVEEKMIEGKKYFCTAEVGNRWTCTATSSESFCGEYGCSTATYDGTASTKEEAVAKAMAACGNPNTCSVYGVGYMNCFENTQYK